MGLKPATNPDVEAVTIELSIDGKSVIAKSGVSLYDVISSTGKVIPAMCYHYTFDPFGSCGMCLVMQEGKKAPVRSCTAKAAAGMIVKTDGDDLFLARKKAVERMDGEVLFHCFLPGLKEVVPLGFDGHAGRQEGAGPFLYR